MFSLSEDNVAAAERCFTETTSLHEASSFHAFRAYLSAFRLEERGGVDRQEVLERMRDEVDRALRLDASNGLTLSLLAHVHAFVLRDLERARDLIEQAQALGSSHVLTHDAEALLSVYGGHPEAARAAAMKTAMLGRFLSYRYAFVTSLCMTSALSGDYEAGIRHGRLALSLGPRGGKRLGAVTRYLGARHSQVGQLDEARSIYERLITDMPHLTSDAIGTPESPVPSGPAAILIRDGLKRVGL